MQRVRQEASFAAALTLAAPTLATPDVIVAVSPSFPALVPAMASASARRIPWVLWLQDILPDGAVSTGLVKDGAFIRMARRLENAAYRSASRIFVVSDGFAENLRAKGVPREKIVRCYNPASRPILEVPRDVAAIEPTAVLTMGNIGLSQNLVAVTRAFEDSEELRRLNARFVLAGDGQAGDEVRAVIRTDRVRVTGILDTDALERELRRAAVAVVSQGYERRGVQRPVEAHELHGLRYPHRRLGASGLGGRSDHRAVGRGLGHRQRATPPTRPPGSPPSFAILGLRADRGHKALDYARANFSPERAADHFETTLRNVAG